jgi:hypothetical protein
LNGQAYRKAFISHEDLMKGGALEFEMSAEPVRDAFNEFPVSSIESNSVSVPSIETDKSFKNQTQFFIKTSRPGLKVFYSTDGSQPNFNSTIYVSPFILDGTSVVKAIAVDPKGDVSPVAETRFVQKPNNWTVSIASKYNRQYTGGGDEGLIDGIRGTTNFSSGEWQGYQGQDFVATVDLQKVAQILTVGGGFLQNARSWIWMPTHIEFEFSQDGVNFTKVADIKTDVAPDDMEPRIRDYTTRIKPVTARYVRVHAYNFGKIPSWHPGAGGDAWIFVDEIIIR